MDLAAAAAGLFSGRLRTEASRTPLEQGGRDKASTGRKRIDDEIFQPCMPAGRPQLRKLQRTDQDDRNGRGQHTMLPVGEAECQTDQHESQRVFAILPEIGVRPVARWAQSRKSHGGGKQPGGEAEQDRHTATDSTNRPGIPGSRSLEQIV
jgi:hypothetical protein